MSSATTLSTPQDQVESLMKEIAEENDLDITDQLKDLNPTTSSIRADREQKREDDLSRRYPYCSDTNLRKWYMACWIRQHRYSFESVRYFSYIFSILNSPCLLIMWSLFLHQWVKTPSFFMLCSTLVKMDSFNSL